MCFRAWVSEGVRQPELPDGTDPQEYDAPINQLNAQIDPLGRRLGPSFKLWTIRADGGGQPQTIRGISTAWPADTVWAGHRR